jgi:hypothetical protein
VSRVSLSQTKTKNAHFHKPFIGLKKWALAGSVALGTHRFAT